MNALSTLAALALLVGGYFPVRPEGDLCHVYVVDIKAAKKAAKKFEETDDPKTLSRAQTVFPAFETRILEEVFTTRHYRFPKGRLIITASVFYTDESMASKVGEEINPESMLLGIAVTRKKEEDAIYNLADNAVTEVGYDDNLSTVRVKKHVKVRGKLYLVGLECDCNAKKKTASSETAQAGKKNVQTAKEARK